VQKHASRLGIDAKQIRGSCTDSAGDVPVTFVAAMTMLLPL
jgi:hypothetical protein